MTENEISKHVLDAAFKIHKALGPGLLESAYENCLCYEIRKIGLEVKKQKALSLFYEDIQMDIGYRVDLFIENRFVVEVKSVDALNSIHFAQILTYLRLSDSRLGLLINFNVTLLKDGIKRVINGYLEN